MFCLIKTIMDPAFNEFAQLQAGRRQSIHAAAIKTLLESSNDHFALWLEILTHTTLHECLPDPVLAVLKSLAFDEPTGAYKNTLDIWLTNYRKQARPPCPHTGKLPRFYAACLASHLRDHPVVLG